VGVGFNDVEEDYKDYSSNSNESQAEEEIVSDNIIPVRRHFIHPKFNPITNENDIALLRLDRTVENSGELI
jgi:hypothetical protein